MKIACIPKIVFDEEEITALQTLARIECTTINCEEDHCPFNIMEGLTAHCVKSEIKGILKNSNISW